VGATEILGTGDRVSYERRFEQVIGNSPLWKQCSNKSNGSRLRIPPCLSREKLGTGKELIAATRFTTSVPAADTRSSD